MTGGNGHFRGTGGRSVMTGNQGVSKNTSVVVVVVGGGGRSGRLSPQKIYPLLLASFFNFLRSNYIALDMIIVFIY